MIDLLGQCGVFGFRSYMHSMFAVTLVVVKTFRTTIFSPIVDVDTVFSVSFVVAL